MGRDQRYSVTFQQTRSIFTAKFNSVVRDAAEKAGYTLNGFALFMKDTSRMISDFYISGNGKSDPESLRNDLEPYGKIIKMKKI